MGDGRVCVCVYLCVCVRVRLGGRVCTRFAVLVGAGGRGVEGGLCLC